jgi:dTDP-4-amino-4,6-dideoxygalactose transaminase
MQKLLVSEPSLNNFEEFVKHAKDVWESGILTHNGPKVQELEKKLKEKFDIPHLSLVTNGTIALELAFRALNLPKGSKIITTPFTWIATASAIQWQDYEPLFVDINPKTLNIDPKKIEEALNTYKNVSAILAVHVFSNPCEVEEIGEIANKWNVKVIYDGAHSVGVRYEGRDLSQWGDITTHSYHATKIYNCGEGGSLITTNEELSKRIERIRFFGHDDKKDIVHEGTNAKMHEISASIGLANLPMLDKTIIHRKLLNIMYRHRLEGAPVEFQQIIFESNNFSYFPVIFDSEEDCLRVYNELLKIDVIARRYFFPSLNEIKIFERTACPISEDISRRILCLPCHDRVHIFDVDKISRTIINTIVR